MKVLSFLQYCCMLNSRDDSYDYQSFFDNVVSKCSITERAFYSQVFKPQLITELFEGWICENYKLDLGENDFYKFYDGFNHVRIYPVTNIYSIIVYYADEVQTDFVVPRTLDDFITDCQRAGIELTWKNKEGGE